MTALDNIVTQFNTYEDFLDSQITTVDLYYLEVSAGRPWGPRRGLVAPWRGRRAPQVSGFEKLPPPQAAGVLSSPSAGVQHTGRGKLGHCKMVITKAVGRGCCGQLRAGQREDPEARENAVGGGVCKSLTCKLPTANLTDRPRLSPEDKRASPYSGQTEQAPFCGELSIERSGKSGKDLNPAIPFISLVHTAL